MAMVNVGHSSLMAGLQPKSVGLVRWWWWRSAAAWRSPAFVRWTTCIRRPWIGCPCYGDIEIVEVILLLLVLLLLILLLLNRTHVVTTNFVFLTYYLW